MKSPLFWVVLGYMNSIFLFFNQSSMLMFWCLLEINMIMLIGTFFFIDELDKMMNSEQCLYYFLIQSLGSFLVLLSFKFSNLLLVSSLSSFLFSLAILLKMGLWPASSWIFNLGSSISQLKMFFILSIQKIPLFYLIFGFPSLFLYFLMVVSFLAGAMLIFSSMSMMDMLISSSIYSTVWVSYLFNNSPFIFFIYIFLYFFFLYFLLLNASSSSLDKIFMMSSFIFFLGLPPFSLFFFKITISNWIMGDLGSLDFLLFWFVSFLGLLGYSKMFFQCLFTKFLMYLNDEFFSQKMFIFMMPSSLLFLFLI